MNALNLEESMQHMQTSRTLKQWPGILFLHSDLVSSVRKIGASQRRGKPQILAICVLQITTVSSPTPFQRHYFTQVCT